MKTLTKKQRREIYLKVASIYGNLYVMDASLCRNICRTMDWVRLRGDYRSEYMFKKMFRLLPEFKLFKPTENNEHEFLVNSEGLWFSTIDERIICMLLCAEMCNQ